MTCALAVYHLRTVSHSTAEIFCRTRTDPASGLDAVAFPRPAVAHNSFLRVDERPALLAALRVCGGAIQTRLGPHLFLLKGGHTGELRLATPDQFDLKHRFWIIPPEVVKQFQMGMHRLEVSTEPGAVHMSLSSLMILQNKSRIESFPAAVRPDAYGYPLSPVANRTVFAHLAKHTS